MLGATLGDGEHIGQGQGIVLWRRLRVVLIGEHVLLLHRGRVTHGQGRPPQRLLANRPPEVQHEQPPRPQLLLAQAEALRTCDAQPPLREHLGQVTLQAIEEVPVHHEGAAADAGLRGARVARRDGVPHDVGGDDGPVSACEAPGLGLDLRVITCLDLLAAVEVAHATDVLLQGHPTSAEALPGGASKLWVLPAVDHAVHEAPDSAGLLVDLQPVSFKGVGGEVACAVVELRLGHDARRSPSGGRETSRSS
mmetsp:Transcript_98321/g.311910  ORF Transcript_98321/g.311910 Transcript_98321/m.311910 type:complete len:251 (-) Transcript_98321:450-1202(-)